MTAVSPGATFVFYMGKMPVSRNTTPKLRLAVPPNYFVGIFHVMLSAVGQEGLYRNR